MILATGQGLGRQYSGDPIFLDVRFEIRAGERIGLVGTNGAGKSTLIRLISGEDQPDYGSVFIRPGIRVGHLKQEPDFDPRLTLKEVARSGLASLLELQDQVAEAARELAEAEDEEDRRRAAARYDELNDRLNHQDGYSLDHRVEEVLSGLGFDPSDYDRPASTFSGGQQSRLMLAKLLLQAPDLMLLDEPSNHLDIATTAWLESYLARQSAAMVIVSHDRYFLDRVVTKIWELHEGKITAYPGNYTQYWRLREERAKVLERQAQKQAEEIADLQDFIRRNAAGQKAKQAHDREKKLARIEQVETLSDIVGPVMGFDEVERSGDIVIEARDLTKGFGGPPLFKNFNITILRGQCVAVMGPNGAGKSTLLKTLIGRLKPDSGQVKIGHKVQIGYYDQKLEELPADMEVLRAVWPENDPGWVETEVRTHLAKFGLTGDIAHRQVGQLSGGEKGKAALARLAATGANLLVMDEPTNHLDIWSCQALERSIQEFEGTVLVVSHDRYFLNQVADRLIVVDNGRAEVVEGDYETYQRLVKERKEAADAAEVRRQANAHPNGAGRSSVASAAGDAKGKEKRKRKFPYRRPKEVEADIAHAEAQLAELEVQLADPETYKNPERAKACKLRHDQLTADLERLYAHWEEALELNA